MNITLQQQNVLEALAEFRYLTAQQMIDLGVSKSITSLRDKTLSRLERHKKHFIKSHDFGWIPQKGRLAKIFYLTKNGVKILAEYLRIEPDQIDYPKGGIQFSIDYSHRIHFIDFHIAFKDWAEQQKKEIEFFHAYFDKIGNQRAGKVRSTAKTRVQLERTIYTELKSKPFIPDGLTRYQDGDKSRLVAIEIHNGVHSKRITHQLLEHLEALDQGLFSHKYQHKKMNFILSVHENQSTLDSVKRRLMERPEFRPLAPLFLFNRQDQAKADFSRGWTLADGSKTSLFQ